MTFTEISNDLPVYNKFSCKLALTNDKYKPTNIRGFLKNPQAVADAVKELCNYYAYHGDVGAIKVTCINGKFAGTITYMDSVPVNERF